MFNSLISVSSGFNGNQGRKSISLHNNYYISGKPFPSIQIRTGFFLLFCYREEGSWQTRQRRKKQRGGEMATSNSESGSDGRKIGPWNYWGIIDDSRQIISQGTDEQRVLIGQWYYYLYSDGMRIDLCRTEPGEPVFTEVMDPAYLAISYDDLEYAVQLETCGFPEPGYYRISPFIERKLRILFE